MNKLSALSLLAVTLAMPTALVAAPPAQTPSSAIRSASNSYVSDAQLHQFAAAYREVTLIRKKLMIGTHGVTDEQKIATLKTQAEEKMKQAIRTHLTLGEYVRIGKAVNADPVLHVRFMRIRDSERKAPAPASG